MAHPLSDYDRLILSEPTLLSYTPLHDAGNLTSKTTYDYKRSVFGTYNSGGTQTGDQLPLLRSDPRSSVLFSSGGSVLVPDPTLPSPTNTWALEAWTINHASSGSLQGMIGIGFESGTQEALFGTVDTNNKFFLGYFSNPSGLLLEAGNCLDGKAHHLFGGWDGTDWWFWFDSVFVGKVANTSTVGVNPGYRIGTTTQGGLSYNGEISNAAFYSTVPTQAMVTRHYQAGLRNATIPLVTPIGHYWPIMAVSLSTVTNVNVSDSSNATVDAVSIAAALAVSDASNAAVDTLAGILASVPVAEASNAAVDAVSMPGTSLTVADIVAAAVDTASVNNGQGPKPAVYTLSDSLMATYTLSDSAAAVYTLSDSLME